MGSNEEYLDRLLRQVNGEVIEEENDGEASEKLAGRYGFQSVVS